MAVISTQRPPILASSGHKCFRRTHYILQRKQHDCLRTLMKPLFRSPLSLGPSQSSHLVIASSSSLSDMCSREYDSERHFSLLELHNELLIQIVSLLSPPDILSLSHASKNLRALVKINESTITRRHLAQYHPEYSHHLEDATPFNLQLLTRHLRRVETAETLSLVMSEFLTQDVFNCWSNSQRQQFAAAYNRMRRRLANVFVSISTFLEKYRRLGRILDKQSDGTMHDTLVIQQSAFHLTGCLGDEALVRSFQIFPLLISLLRGRLRRVPGLRLRHHVVVPSTSLFDTPDIVADERHGTERLAEILRYLSDGSWACTRPTHLGNDNSSQGTSTSSVVALQRNQGVATEFSISAEEAGRMLISDCLSAFMEMLNCHRASHMLGFLAPLQIAWMDVIGGLILKRKIVSKLSDIKQKDQVILDLIRA